MTISRKRAQRVTRDFVMDDCTSAAKSSCVVNRAKEAGMRLTSGSDKSGKISANSARCLVARHTL